MAGLAVVRVRSWLIAYRLYAKMPQQVVITAPAMIVEFLPALGRRGVVTKERAVTVVVRWPIGKEV